MPDDRIIKSMFATSIVQMAIAEASDVVAVLKKQYHADELRCMSFRSKAESPIEAAFWVWFYTMCGLNRRAGNLPLAAQLDVEANGNKYRLDYAIPPAKIAVELDGHEFHEKTKEQVARRNMRDRDLQAAGWTVLHFSGSEIYRQGAQCALAVIDLALERYTPPEEDQE
jgi:very-short-patch-repair endonuclease